MKILIREDDTNFFTNHKHIESVYKNCFTHGIRISIGVTPLQEKLGGIVRTDIPKKIKSHNSFNIIKNKRLCRYLKKLSDRGNEICLHGVFHNNKDTGFSKEFVEKFNISREILEKISGKPVKTYIPPFNIVSKDILNLVQEKNMNISYRVNDKYSYLKSLYWNNFFSKGLISNNGHRIFLMKDYIFGYKLSKKKEPKKCFEHAMNKFNINYKINKRLILSNHYWDFYKEDFTITPMIYYWNKFINVIKKMKDVEFVTFDDYN